MRAGGDPHPHGGDRRALFAVRQTVAVIASPAGPTPDTDPRPAKPEPPLPAECCDSGCVRCVCEVYDEQLQAWREALALWRQRHPDVDDAPA